LREEISRCRHRLFCLIEIVVAQWTVKGEVLLIGDSPQVVKLGCFYTNCSDFYYASQTRQKCPPARLVSNAASFGPSGGAFTLRIDASLLAPSAGHYMYLILWDDRNGNDEYDSAEDWRYVIPLYDDTVFLGATDCVYFYDDQPHESIGTARGWNQSIGLDRYVPVDRAEWEGARVANEVAWCGGAAAAGAAVDFAQSAFPHVRLP
jgi:hypothetical protein